MNERKVYLGAFNNKNKKVLQQKSINYLKDIKGDKFYYLLPNGDLLKKYRREFIKAVEGTFEMNLFTFDDVVNEVIESSFLKTIDTPMKSLIIRNILEKLSKSGDLVYYKEFVNMKGFTESCINIIREVKRSLITPDTFLKKCPDLRFYKEMGLIYKEYEGVLVDKSLSDRESDYLDSINTIKSKEDFLTDLDYIIIDEFYDFRPIELEIIKELSKKNIDIFINMPFGSEQDNLILKNSVDKLIDIGFDIEYLDNESKNIFEDFGSKLFTYNKDKYDYIKEIELVKSPSSYLELKKIFKEVKQKLSQGLSLSEMGVVLLSDSYSDNLFKVSKEENLPLSISKTTSLAALPLVKEFCNLIKSKLSQDSKESIINRIKSSYFPISNQDIRDELEYIVRRLNFNNIEELDSILKDNKNLKIPNNSLYNLIELIKKIKHENDSVHNIDSVTNYNKFFLQLINGYEVDKNIINKYKIINDYNIFHRDLSTLEKLKELLNKMDEVALVEKELSIEAYYQVLQDSLLEESIIEIGENLNGLNIMTPINARGKAHKILFIAGLSQEEYPRLNNSSFFLSDDKINYLRKIGIDIKDYHERYSNEALKFSTLFSSCTEKLYLSFSENSQEEGKDIPSMFLDEILSRIDGDEIKDKLNFTTIEMDYLINCDIDSVTCEKDFTNTLLYKYFKGEVEDDYLFLHNSTYKDKLKSINKVMTIESKRALIDFNEYSGLLNDTLIYEKIKNDFKDKVYSISYLESYSKCPYAFLLNNIFKVEEMGRTVEDFNPIDIGTVYHEVLNDYYNSYKEKLTKDIKSFNVEDTIEYLREISMKYALIAGYKNDISKDLLIIENIYLRLLNFIKVDIDRLKDSPDNIIPWGFEVEFGRDNPFVIEVNNEKILLRGKIDRIDQVNEKDNYIVIDYKSSAYGKKDLSDIESGLSLQLPVYIMSQTDKNIVAGSYSTLSDGEFFTAMGILGESSSVTKRQKGSMDKAKWDQILNQTKEKIYNIVAAINNGEFSVNPLDCSPYCIYKDICRYEKVMEVDDGSST